MITESIIVALITAVTTITGTFLVNRREIHKENNKKELWESFIEQRINTIEKKIDEHNHYAQKFGEIEKSIIAIQKDIEYIKKERS